MATGFSRGSDNCLYVNISVCGAFRARIPAAVEATYSYVNTLVKRVYFAISPKEGYMERMSKSRRRGTVA